MIGLLMAQSPLHPSKPIERDEDYNEAGEGADTCHYLNHAFLVEGVDRVRLSPHLGPKELEGDITRRVECTRKEGQEKGIRK